MSVFIVESNLDSRTLATKCTSTITIQNTTSHSLLFEDLLQPLIYESLGRPDFPNLHRPQHALSLVLNMKVGYSLIRDSITVMDY